jgi:O-antigen ligase
MTSTTMSMPGTRSALSLDRVAFGLLLAFVAALQISIAASHVLLTATLLCWATLRVREHARPQVPPFFLPLVAYAVWTLVATLFSFNFGVSLLDDKQLLLFLIVPAVYDLARGDRGATVIDIIVSVGAASAAVGIIQYAVLHWDALDKRPQGVLTHYMTYSGVLMLVICAAVARLVFGSRDRTWPAVVMPALVVALALTSTRGAWIGACAGVAVIVASKKIQLIALVPVALVIVFALAPQGITARMQSIFNLQDPTIRDRVAMMKTGAAIIGDQPVTGIGPDMVPRMYVEYRDELAVNATNPHLHNVPLQIAAERGLPALALWLWFIVSVVVHAWRQFRSGGDRVLAAGALGAVAAMLGAGMFEYNFGDSEFLMLFLVLITLPFAARHDHLVAPGAR